MVIYDDLAADHSAEWSWLLHSSRKMTASVRLQRLTTRNATARGQVDLRGSTPLRIEVDDRFDPPALNWRGKLLNGKVPEEFPKQWHATAVPTSPTEVFRYLAILQIRPIGEDRAFEEPVMDDAGAGEVGDWRIEAVLDPGQPAGLAIRHRDGRAVLAVDRSAVRVGRTSYRGKDTSLLVEGSGRTLVVQRSKDEGPHIE